MQDIIFSHPDGSRIRYDVIKGKGIVLHVGDIPQDIDRIVKLVIR